MNKAIKTKNQISQALIELLNNKPLDLITIKELAKKAEISRTAFYNNFNNLDDVLKYIYQRAHKQIFKEKYSQLEYVYSDEHILDMISFFDKNSKLLLVLIKWNLIELIAKYNTENAEIYNRNADEYIEKIEELNRNYKEELSNLSGKKAICLNEAFSYLARDLNLDIIMVETDHEESTLSADKLKELIKQVKESNIQVIIIGENDNTQNAETIAKETNAKIYKLKTGMGGDYSQDSYLKDMEYNLNVLKKIGK